MEKQKLRFGATFREGLVYAGRNFFPLLGCILLYFLTIWIPYLNIGTMIAMTLLPVQMSGKCLRGNLLIPLIFLIPDIENI